MPITLSEVVHQYPSSSLPTLRVPSFVINDGEHLALVGRSGSGKSTLLNLIAGILTPTAGTIDINGTDITKLSEAKRDLFRAENIGYVFQTFNLIQSLSALENVLLAMSFASKVEKPKARAEELLQQVGLDGKYHKKPRELSVGEQQRVAIARAIANEPRIILADEPTANLDEQNANAVLNLLLDLSSRENRILILVTHERDVAARLPRALELKTINRI
ncbi:MAG: ABC transporter ATP-binding protein [Chloroherpetonaceae bacterium]|nr:ABC transporter ATP-binding protein [Chloroherpetonaceae bacterium]MCS7211336.1 ABC transporter ATP-binding protein [Chloroherpetonaceae bacterium]MDW8020384.1 ABC transporter ATP-binding protein [Chloroherpetonaceae bacterium]MDW8465900.1 ABC transporter ATP-binding protein [Chloroherpetonaceae bacterium]